MHESLQHFHPVIARWFEEKVGIPTPPQVLGWPAIHAGRSALVLAPTGSGKTLAAFLCAIDWLVRRLIDAESKDETLRGIQILYISPLKSLANDVQKNLIGPLGQIADTAAAMKVRDWPEIAVAVRTGDTPQRERAAMLRHPPHILITTPESLNLMLTSGARTALASTRFLIVDEVHALAGTKRGVFLSLLLERLEEERAHLSPGWQSGASRSPRVETAPRPAPARHKIAPGVYMSTEPSLPLVRIGLSATARPEDHIAHWLAGNTSEGTPRAIDIIRTGQRKLLDLQVVAPYQIGDDGPDEPSARTEPSATVAQPAVKGTGHWPEVTRAVLQMIRDHKSTLVFGNSRRLVENLAARFQEEFSREDAAPTVIENQKSKIKNPVILPHHGSISKEARLETEQMLKRGEVDAVLATSSLELGIDIGSLDLVVQLDSPGTVAAGLQRVGRAGHLEKATAKGRFIARGSHELAAFGALLPLMFEGRVEETRVPANCLDVLAQQIVAACVVKPWKRGDLFKVFKRATPYEGLAEKQFDSVVEMLARRADRVAAQGLRPRISFDRVNDELIILPGSAQIVMANSGVISETGQYPVYLAGATRGRTELHAAGDATRSSPPSPTARANGPSRAPSAPEDAPRDRVHGVRLGELDEEFVYETKEGDRIILGSQTWRVARIDDDRVLVEHASPGSSRMPFWRGESAPRSELLGEAITTFYGDIEQRLTTPQIENQKSKIENPPPPPLTDWLTREHHFDDQAADNATLFFTRQLARGSLPNAHRLVVEHFTDRTGEPAIAILCPLGRRVNYALRLALEVHFAKRRLPAQIVHNDDGILIRPPTEIAGNDIPQNPLVWLRSTTLEHEITDQLEATSLFGLRFRQNAARALMLPKMNLDRRTPLWQQRLRARHLLALVKRQRNFPIIVETYRECLQDALNIPRVVELLGRIESGTVAIKIVRHEAGESASPLANSLYSQFTASYLYQWDEPLVGKDVEPTVDQRVLDEILQRRGQDVSDKPALEKTWTDADEEALRRRIWSLDYPARTAEELLEKIESTGAVGIAADDSRLAEWTLGNVEEAQRMLADLTEKRRLLNPGWQSGASRSRDDSAATIHYLATENVALLLAAGAKVTRIPRDLPPALLESTLTRDEARRTLVEQAARAHPTFTPDDIAAALPWMTKEAARWLEALTREGRILAVAGRLVWHEYAEQLRALALRRERRATATVDLAALQRHLLDWQHVRGIGVPPMSSEQGTNNYTSPVPAHESLSHGSLTTPRANIGGTPMPRLDDTEDLLDMFTGLAFPLAFWEYEIFPARIPDFSPALLDGICKNGHRVWVGGPAGTLAFWPRHLLGQRRVQASAFDTPAAALSATAERVKDFLHTRGASFQMDIQLALSLDDAELAVALRELAAASLLSCDDLANFRDVERLAGNADREHARAGRGVRPARLGRNWWKHSGTSSGGLGGRWFLLPPPAAPATALDVAQAAADRAERLLRRTGFAARELLDPADGSWKDAYDVLTRMEWAGTVRRGYFVDGISGAQFAAPNSPLTRDPLRNTASVNGSRDVTWLAMLDPANVWSRANTRWISDTGLAARVPRAPGNWIALIEGHPVLAATAWGQRLIPLPASEGDQHLALGTLSSLLPRLPRADHPYLAVRFWDQLDVLGTPAEELLRQQGFSRDTHGLRLYRQYVTSP